MHLITDMDPCFYATLPAMTACDSQLLAAIQSLQMEDNPEPSRTPLRSRPPPFLRLLTEIHLEITSYFEAMGDPEILQLSCTCRYFRQIIAKPDHQLLLKIEKHPLARYAGVQLFLACRYCLRLRKRCYFSDRMLRKTGVCGTHCHLRYCVDCGFTNPQGPCGAHYSPGTYLTLEGRRWLCCRVCTVWETVNPYLDECGTCKDCHAQGTCRFLKRGGACGIDLVGSIPKKAAGS